MIETLNLHGGFLKLSTPYRWYGLLGYALFGIMALVGLVMSLTNLGNSEDIVAGMAISILGLSGLAVTTPSSHQKDLYNLRQQAIDPEVLEAKAKESGLSIDNWFLKQTTYVPTNDPSDWVLPAPGPAVWDKLDIYKQDGDGSPIAEHPVKVGTPVPATFTLFGIFGILASLFTVIAVGIALTEVVDSGSRLVIIGIMAIIGLILLIIGWFKSKMLTQMLDLQTSVIRSVPLGYNELVGQVRPSYEGVLRVVVDGNQNMYMENMVGFRWTYEQEQKRTVTTKDGTRTETRWVTIREDSGGCPFILHDGTGGIRVNGENFKRSDYGDFIKRWDSAFAKSLGQQFFAQLVAGFVGGWRVTDHRWTLYGLKMGNPVYLVGQVKSKSNAMIAEEGLDGTLPNSIIEVFGNEDGPGAKSTLKRGTELTNLGRSRSKAEMILPAMILFLGAISLLVLA